jgi:diguanylate cyclase (GGDEF)-like protein
MLAQSGAEPSFFGRIGNDLEVRNTLAGTVRQYLWDRVRELLGRELQDDELPGLLLPHRHITLLTMRRATMIVNRARLIAAMFAVLTPLWSIIDYLVFPTELWLTLAVMRILVAITFASIVFYYRPSGNLLDAYRALALLFFIPTVFYFASHQVLSLFHLTGISAAIGAGYAFLPFVLLAGLAIFPLTALENIALASPILLIHGLSGVISLPLIDWPSYAGAFWLLALLTGVSMLAGMSQLAFMITLVRQAVRDPLTGAFSRRSGEELLGMQFSISLRSDVPLSLAFLDLDHFKAVNDGFGHEAGDLILKGVGQRINSRLRTGDMLIRWGGEEFLLLMPHTDIHQADTAIARLRQHGFGQRPDGEEVTASIGIAERFRDRAPDFHFLLEAADHRMYLAKKRGRNLVVADG